jgi:hypothetical protein
VRQSEASSEIEIPDCRPVGMVVKPFNFSKGDNEMAYYQCFKTTDRVVYCSSFKVKNHDEGADWVRQALEHFNLKANDIKGKPYESDDIPEGATTHP